MFQELSLFTKTMTVTKSDTILSFCDSMIQFKDMSNFENSLYSGHVDECELIWSLLCDVC